MTEQLVTENVETAEPSEGDHIPDDGSFRVSLVAETILAAVREQLAHEQFPSATYRLQFHRQFTFRNATSIIDYLHKLGVSHIYASPYLQARQGSVHGYDIVNHNNLNPEIGGESDLDAFVQELRRHQMGHILDFVPNHMGIGTDENPWWQDVLENGPSSPYASFFDISWHPLKPDLDNKVLLPVLGDQFGNVLEQGQLVLQYAEGTFSVTYFGRRFPIGPQSSLQILQHRLDQLESRLGIDHPQYLEYQSILTALGHLPPSTATEPEKMAERQREKEIIKGRLARLAGESTVVAEFLAENVKDFNGRPGEPNSFDLLDNLLQDQAYRLSYWRVAADEINYRRFFDVNELAAVCMERPEVFEKAHALIFRLFEEQKVDGLRIDHADGLYDPNGYFWELQEQLFLQHCRRVFRQLESQPQSSNPVQVPWPKVELVLRSHFAQMRADEAKDRLARPLYLLVEKILEGRETLPNEWPVHGTTGYEFAVQLNGLFVDRKNARAMDTVYSKFIGARVSFTELVYASKKLIMKVSMSSELHALGYQLDRISERHRTSRDFTLNGLTDTVREIVACFPVYRTYASTSVVSDRDRQYVEQAVARAKRRNPAVSQAAFDFVRELLLLKNLDAFSEEEQHSRLQFVGRFQQFTGPMMAKAVEDTAFYCYNRLVSLNEVGGNPEEFGQSVTAFHQQNAERQASHPHGLLATSTHDTKRSEDVRARINVLSEMPVEWKSRVFTWTRWNKRKKVKVDGELAPSRNDEYLLYQTLIGTWPFEPPHGEALDNYVPRIQQYMTKALREAKVNSSWIAPNETYEQAVRDFITAILADAPGGAFRADFEPFVSRISRVGMWNSLSQTLLKLTSPGVPDIYQGTELWDFSLVDPDNRRPVDFESRRDALSNSSQIEQLMDSATDGRIKLFLTQQCLNLRRQLPALWTTGEYVPLTVEGAKAEHVRAFGRREGTTLAITIAPIRVATLLGESNNPPIGPVVWDDTRIILPSGFSDTVFKNVLTNRSDSPGQILRLADALDIFPVGLLISNH